MAFAVACWNHISIPGMQWTDVMRTHCMALALEDSKHHPARHPQWEKHTLKLIALFC